MSRKRAGVDISSRDCVVIGGGPAGSTFAAMVGKYAPNTRVTVMEKARFPRWHIGESTIPVANGVLRDLGVYDDLVRSSHVKKIGAVFVWGKDREPWNAEYLALEGLSARAGRDDTIDVTGQDFGSLVESLDQPESFFLSFNVRRAEFDHMLLDRARDFGAEVREGTRVTEVLRDGQGAIEGVRWRDDKGATGTVDTPFVLDASGLSALMTKDTRTYDPTMNNFAVFGYLTGADWKVTFAGSKQYTTLFVATVPTGWIWYFPVDEDTISIGAVTNTDHFRDRLQDVDVEDFFWEMLRACPELSGLVKHGELRDDVLPGGKRVGACKEWASWSDQFVGDGWAAAGDAAVFLDPVLASGLTLALMSGHRAAYTFNTVNARPEVDSGGLWRAYSDYLRGEAASFLKLCRYFYANNKSAESWWWEAQAVVNESGRFEMNDKQAFALATAGYFPTPRAISPEVMGPILTHLSGSDEELDASSASAVPAEVLDRRIEVAAPFRLDVQTEPITIGGTPGTLDVYYDLVTDSPEWAHRLAADPCRIPPVMSPVVEAIPRFDTVAELIDAAPSLLPAGVATPEAIRRATLEIVRVAAAKGFLRLQGD